MVCDMPVLGICGWSGSGKTTLIERIVPLLRARGLKIAVAKHDAHGIELDRPGKDSDRFFQAGADVHLRGPGQEFLRKHPGSPGNLTLVLESLCREYDLVLVEGYKDTPIPKVWLAGPGTDETPPTGRIIRTLPRDSDRVGAVMSLLETWLPAQWLRTPVYGCVLLGDRSARGERLERVTRGGMKTSVERTVRLLGEFVEKTAVAGAADVPGELCGCVRLADVLAAMRWAPGVSWLVASCRLPDLTPNALQWLLSTRAPGVWATPPQLEGGARVEPLLAHYDFRSRALLECLAIGGELSLDRIGADRKVATPSPPPLIAPTWRQRNPALCDGASTPVLSQGRRVL